MVIVALFLWRAPMTARQTVPRVEAFAYAVRSLWGFHVIYGETGHGNLEMDRSHDRFLPLALSSREARQSVFPFGLRV